MNAKLLLMVYYYNLTQKNDRYFSHFKSNHLREARNVKIYLIAPLIYLSPPPIFTLQPALSVFDSPTNQLPNYVTHFMQPFVKTLPLYICYSNCFMQLLQSFPAPPDSTYPHHLQLVLSRSLHTIFCNCTIYCALLPWHRSN